MLAFCSEFQRVMRAFCSEFQSVMRAFCSEFQREAYFCVIWFAHLVP